MKPIVKIDIEEYKDNKKPLIIELGCGPYGKSGRIGIDQFDGENVQIVADLEEGLPFLDDNTVDEIHSSHVFEHIENLELLIKEIMRVLKKYGKCYISVPHFSNPYYYSDYTHKTFFGLYSFSYFIDIKNQPFKRKVGTFYSDIRMDLIDVKLKFGSHSSVRNILKRIIEKNINRSRFMQEFYEECLCWIIPCSEITYIIQPCLDS
jgi:ubiquinone/menaquinone biosynthesis C-methylase UbiE